MLNKKGTDKPIEIFIALFIILAVAMIILKMFSGQIQDKTKELQKIEQQQAAQQARADAERQCSEICTSVLQNDCSLQHKARYCSQKLKDGLDINADGDTDDYSEDLLSFVGVCENSVYCPQISTCECRGEMTMSNCVGVLMKYSTEVLGYSQDEACKLVASKIKGDTCIIPESSTFWFDTLKPRFAQEGCSI